MMENLAETLVRERPSFLTRTPGDTKPVRRPCPNSWKVSPLMKEAIEKDRKKREKIEARPAVRKAVKAGADTVGKIRKATDLETSYIQAALRFYMKIHKILRVGKRYYWEG